MTNWFYTKMQMVGRWRWLFFTAVVLLFALITASLANLLPLPRSSTPQTVVQQYMASLYAQNFGRAYALISTADKTVKSEAEYLRENSSFTSFALEVTQQLASYIEYREIQVDRQGNRATVTVQFIVPDGNSAAVREILFVARPGENDLPEAERNALLEKLNQLHARGQLPTFEGEQTFELVQEGREWRIFENWAEAVRIHFSGEVKDNLSWELEPLQEIVLAKPGENLRTVYRVKNLSDQLITAKARHIDAPAEYLNSLTIVQCFCFVQQTLKPGEEMELPLTFRVAWDVPSEVKEFHIHYEFYPLESFPEE